MSWLNNKITLKAALFLLPIFLYEDLLISVLLSAVGIWLLFHEKIAQSLHSLSWREYLFYLYLFHMLFGERDFAYLGFEPIFITEIVLGLLVVAYHKELLQVRSNLLIYYLLVGIGLLWAVVYFYNYRIDALRDSLMLVYAIWVPVIYHVFNKKRGYDLFFNLLKLFIVMKAGSYFYESILILLDIRQVVFEGFRFGVGYVVPALIVLSLFVPLRLVGMGYKIISFVMLPAVFTLFHRSIFLGIALGVLLIFLAGRYTIKKNILAYGISTLLVMGAFLFYYNTQVNVEIFEIISEKASTDEGNINFRFLSWEVVMDKFYENFLIGFGVGKPLMYVNANTFYDTINLSYFDLRDLGGNAQPHNSYLNILSRFGILIFPLFLYALWQPFEKIISISRRRVVNNDHYHRFLLLSGLLVLMYVFAFFNVVLEAPHHAFPFWLSIAMILNYGRKRNSPPDRIRLKRPVSPSGGAGSDNPPVGNGPDSPSDENGMSRPASQPDGDGVKRPDSSPPGEFRRNRQNRTAE